MSPKELLALAAALERPSCSMETARKAAEVIREYAEALENGT